MRVMIVDDERLALRQFVMETEDIPDIEVAGAFSNPLQALEYLKENPVEAVFLDIEMPELNGIILAEKMRELYPDLVVIFITGYEQYTLDALKVKADYYMTKPYDSRDIKEVLERAKLLSARQRKRVYIRTFGRFDLFIDGKAVYFSNTKAKELLALCVDHRGGAVTIEEAADKLWEDRIYDSRVKNLYRKAVMCLRQLLLEHGVGIVQLPCPELLCLGLDRGDPQGAERPVVVENTRIRRAMAQAEPSRRLAQLVEDTMTQLLEYRRYGFQVVGILGANRSPCCGVDTTSQDDQEVPGMGVFLEALSHRLEEVGWKIPMVGFRGTDDAVETVQRLLERAEHTARKEAAR